jgi:bacteriorhodopsin
LVKKIVGGVARYIQWLLLSCMETPTLLIGLDWLGLDVGLWFKVMVMVAHRTCRDLYSTSVFDWSEKLESQTEQHLG